MNKGVRNVKNKGKNLHKNGLKLKEQSEVVSLGISDDDDDAENGDDEDAPEYASVSAGEIEQLSDVEMPTACPKGELSALWKKEFEEDTSEMDSRYIRYTITPVMGKFIPPLNFEVSYTY